MRARRDDEGTETCNYLQGHPSDEEVAAGRVFFFNKVRSHFELS